MPKNDKPQDKTPAKDMDPGLESKRSGPAPDASDDGMPTPLADPHAGFPDEHPQPEAAPLDPDDARAIEAKLKDPAFDPEGHERLKLAEQLLAPRPNPPTPSDVDERGDPVQPDERNPERTA